MSTATTAAAAAGIDRNEVTRNVGLVRMDALYGWAAQVAHALGGDVHLYGSALNTKDWRDLDVAVRWAPQPWRGNPMLLLLDAALSRHGSAVIGAPVEVHLHSAPAVGGRLLLATPAGRADSTTGSTT